MGDFQTTGPQLAEHRVARSLINSSRSAYINGFDLDTAVFRLRLKGRQKCGFVGSSTGVLMTREGSDSTASN